MDDQGFPLFFCSKSEKWTIRVSPRFFRKAKNKRGLKGSQESRREPGDKKGARSQEGNQETRREPGVKKGASSQEGSQESRAKSQEPGVKTHESRATSQDTVSQDTMSQDTMSQDTMIKTQ